MGIVYSPFARVSPTPPLLRRPATTCGQCGAHVNLFCTVVSETGEWECAFCNRRNAAFDDKLKHASPTLISDLFPELTSPHVDYTSGGGAGLATGPGRSGTANRHPAIVFVLDGSIPKSGLSRIVEALEEGVASLSAVDPQCTLGLIVFDTVVSIYEVGMEGIASADVYAGDASPSASDLDVRSMDMK